jgi:hypothetical protein
VNGSGSHFWLSELWHPLKAYGYQFWSGVESAVQMAVEKLVYGTVAVTLWWRHHNCHEPGCWRKGHPDPDHGHPVCRRHQDKL